jgi:hypothetical protein
MADWVLASSGDPFIKQFEEQFAARLGRNYGLVRFIE